MKEYKYETHMHTFPVSKCGKASVRDTIEFYKSAGYDGVFLTNHFVGANINYDHDAPYSEQLEFYLTDYYEAKKIGDEIGLKVFFAVEFSEHFNNGSWGGTDFLVYGLDPDWYRAHPEIDGMKKSTLLPYLREQGALVIHAHPYREDHYIDHIRLYPRCIDGVEILNASRPDFESEMARQYAEAYGFLKTAGSDNHRAGGAKYLGVMSTDTPINSVEDFIRVVREGSADIDKVENL